MIFDMGNEVVVVGPDRYGNDTDKTKFTIVMMWSDDGKTFYSDRYSPWYPASSLRLVEELKIGDWVEVVGSPKYFPQYPAKTIFCVTKGPLECKGILGFGGIRNCVDCYCGDGTPFYPPASLRKLTPEEIRQHTATQMPGNFSEIQELRRRIHDLEMGIQGFTNGPEPEYVPGISYVKGPVRDRLSAIEKRLTFVEKFQRDQDDLIGRAIRDGVAEILDFRRKA